MTTGTTVLVIDRQPPVSLNTVLNMNRYTLRDHKRLWKTEAAAAWMNAGQPTFTKPHLTFVLYYRGDRVIRDSDNIRGSLKPLLDGLKGRAFADDDRATIGDPDIVVAVDNERPRVHIILKETA